MKISKYKIMVLLVTFIFMVMGSCISDKGELADAQKPETDTIMRGYLPIVVEGKTWMWGSHPAIGGELRFSEYFSGDTLIGNVKYKKLFRYIIKNNSIEYVCALREKDGKVFCVESGQSDESIIYDFSLKKGDQLSFSVSETIVVDSVTYIKGQNVLSFTFYSGRETIKADWIEGVGVCVGSLSKSHWYGATGSPVLYYCEENGKKIWTRENSLGLP